MRSTYKGFIETILQLTYAFHSHSNKLSGDIKTITIKTHRENTMIPHFNENIENVCIFCFAPLSRIRVFKLKIKAIISAIENQ